MLAALLTASGIALVAIVLFDVLGTTLLMRRGGPIGTFIGRSVWWIMRGLQRAMPTARILPAAGVTILLATILTWLLLSWLGWLLIFAPYPDAVLQSTTGQPADLFSRAYYIGFSLITLGTGDYVPSGPLFQILTIVASAQGFFLITLSITYLVPVISAVVSMRTLAAQIMAIGRTPADILTLSWHDGTMASLNQHLQGIRRSITQLGQQHFAYPVLQYFPTGNRNTEIAIALAVLDEALTILLYGVEDRGGLAMADLRPLRVTIADYLNELDTTFIEPAGEAPPPPDLDALRRQGIPTVGDDSFIHSVLGVSGRRQLLVAPLLEKQFSWDDVWHDDPDHGIFD